MALKGPQCCMITVYVVLKGVGQMVLTAMIGL